MAGSRRSLAPERPPSSRDHTLISKQYWLGRRIDVSFGIAVTAPTGWDVGEL